MDVDSGRSSGRYGSRVRQGEQGMEIFKYEDIPWRDPQVEAGIPSRGIRTKKLAQGVCGFFVGSSFMPAGFRNAPHSHTASELFIVLDGGCTLDSGEVLSANDSV